MSFQLQSRIPQMTAELRKRASALVTKTAVGIQQKAQVSMSGPKSGPTYARKGRVHQASASGEAPAIDYGFLVNSIEVGGDGDLRKIVGSNQEQAVHTEFGTIHMAARPWLGPAFEAQRPEFEQGMRELLK